MFKAIQRSFNFRFFTENWGALEKGGSTIVHLAALGFLDALAYLAALKRSGFGHLRRSGAERHTWLRHWTLHCRLQTLYCELFVVMVSLVSIVSMVRL